VCVCVRKGDFALPRRLCESVCVAGPIRHTQRAANLHILPGASVCPNSSLLPLLYSLSLCSNQSDWRVENRRGWGFVYKEQKPPVKPEEEEKSHGVKYSRRKQTAGRCPALNREVWWFGGVLSPSHTLKHTHTAAPLTLSVHSSELGASAQRWQEVQQGPVCKSFSV